MKDHSPNQNNTVSYTTINQLFFKPIGGEGSFFGPPLHVGLSTPSSLLPAGVVQRWANPDIDLMATLHEMELVDVLRSYVMEDRNPDEAWPSRKEAIKQAIRDRLRRLASAGQLEAIENLMMEVQSTNELLLDDGGWVLRVLRHYAARVEDHVPWDTEATEIPQNPRLFAQLGAAISSHTATVAIFTEVNGVEREFQRAASSFASDHLSFGLDSNGQLIAGADAAMGVQSTTEMAQVIQQIAAQMRMLSGDSQAGIDHLALFAHGVNASRSGNGRSYFNLTDGHQITNLQQQGHGNAADQRSIADFVADINSSIGLRGRVVFYACELGDSFYGGENRGGSTRGDVYSHWNAARRREAEAGAWNDEVYRGDGSFADEFRDALNADGQEREVWGHRTTGHTTRNPSWRQFEAHTTAGAGNVFGEEIADAAMTDSEALALNRRHIALAGAVVRQLADRLIGSPNLTDAVKQWLRGHREGVRGWIARELPFGPTPIMEGDPPVVSDEVIRFLETQAMFQMRS